MQNYSGLEIAVIGLAGRFPGAGTISEYWDNLKNGVHSVQTFSEQELIAAGVEPGLAAKAEYVKAKGYLEAGHCFDARFFDYTPLEAELMDPQMKVFHECIWAALEDAGYAAEADQQLIGLFAGASPNHMWEGLMGLSGKSGVMGHWAASQLLDKDYLSLRIAHKLNLKGPALSIYTACSTSLVAVHMAAQSLLNGECDIALAGGVTITLPEKSGYEYQEGMILSPDGKCRAFDADGKGIVGGDGAGAAVLKRLQDALDDGDQIYAVIKGSAVNNDGLQKTGFTAPSTIGQAEVIRTALKLAEVSPDSIDYIECHGTGTPLGDPIELEALELGYNPERRHACALGSVKTNIGHLDSAAGIASFIKTVLALKHHMLPPSLHFQTPNPVLKVIEKGFYINDRLTEWPRKNEPLRAGISAFGIGGTNAHIIVEQAPPLREASAGREWQLLPVSAKTPSALAEIKKDLEQYSKAEPRRLEDIAYTLQVGRKHFPIRELALVSRKSQRVLQFAETATMKGKAGLENAPVIFVIPDFTQRLWSESELDELEQLYQEEPGARRFLNPVLGMMNRLVPDGAAVKLEDLRKREYHPVLAFGSYYAVGKLLIEWGLHPEAVIGRGKSQWLAACLSGELSLEEAVRSFLLSLDDCGMEQPEAGRRVSRREEIWLVLGAGDEAQPFWDKQSSKPQIVALEKLNTYSLMAAVGTMWLYGKAIKWRELYQHEQRNRLSLPTYAFDRQEFPVDPELFNLNHLLNRPPSGKGWPPANRNDIRKWFYIPAWESAALPNYEGRMLSRDAVWFIFCDPGGLGEALGDLLRQQQIRCIMVEHAEHYQQITADHYRVNPLRSEEMDRLYHSLDAVPDHICYLWTVTSPMEPELGNIETGQQLFLHHILRLVQFLGTAAAAQEIHLQIVSNGLYLITQEEMLCPMKGLLLGASKIIPYEYPNIKVCHVDFPLAEGDPARQREQARQMLREFQYEFPNKQVAYRGKSRWIESVQKPLLLASPGKVSLFKNNLVCMITGGLGGMGLALAEYLAKQYTARLVLVGRSAFPPKSEWDQWVNRPDDAEVTRIIRTLRSLEAAGAVIEVHSADISDFSAMQQVVARAEARLGPITGVLHTAGVADYAGVIQRRTQAMTDEVLLPKVKGTLVLDTLFRNRRLDFFVLFSSIGNYIYGRKFGQVGYNAANEFLDAFVHYRLQHREGFTATINWNDWADAGMSVKAMEKNRSLHKAVNDLQFEAEAITTEQGVNVFRYIMENQMNRVIVSALDLPALMEESNNISVEVILEQEAAAHAMEAAPATAGSSSLLTEAGLQQQIADIWSTVLGMDAIGIDEDFFALGGDSLKAVTIVSLVFKKLGVKLPLPAFFHKPTIREISRIIRETNRTDYARIKRAPQKAGYPLTPGQKRLYFLSQMEQENKQYNNIIALQVNGPLDFGKLEACLKQLIRRHESLRTCFRRIGGEWVQWIEEEVQLALDVVDIKGTVNDKHIEAWIQAFDLAAAPLWKIGVFKEGEHRHLIVFNIHHIITDGTSNAILIDEFTTLYQNDGKPGALPPLTIQYKDYAEWRMDEANTANEAAEAYWLETFSGEIPLLHLPADHSRPAFKTYRGSAEMFSIPKEQVLEIKQLAAEQEATLYMVLFTVWNILLAKLSDQEEIIVGVPTSGRNHSDIEHVIGMFVNTLPIKSRISAKLTFAEILHAMKANISNALEHQDYPFEDLVSQLQITRDFGRNPLFDVMFAFQNANAQQQEAGQAQLNELEMKPYPYTTTTSRFDLTLDGEERAGELVFTLEYATDLFTRETVMRLIRYFRTILLEVLKHPAQKTGLIHLPDDQETDRLLNRFNQTAGEYPEHLTVHQLFAARVKEHPHQAAVTYRNQSITYDELNRRAQQAAYALRAQGIGPDQIVALITTRSVDMIAGILAILQAGGAYLPIDPGLPANRIAYMLDDAGVQVILTNTSVENQGNRIVLDMRSLELDHGAPLPVPPVHSSRNLAYCMYTSGTTGLPKGILVEHRSLLNFFSAISDVLSFGKGETFLSLTTVSFDIFWLESILPLLAGYQVVIADELQQKDVHALLALVKQAGISVMQTTPSRLKLLLADAELAKALGALRYLLIGGEPLPQALADQARSILPGGRIFNLYGPTETTIWSTAQEVTAGPVNIGKPLKNTQVYILNDELLLQPIGVPGILYIGGHGVVRGYQNNPELTAQRFIDNPYRPGEQIYCTGDIAKWTEEGTIEYLGRADFQVKIRGYRIELAEIEQQLDTHPAIEKSVVRAQRDDQDEPMLVAYYTAARTVSGAELREFLLKFLPAYMIPQHFMELGKLPLMISGKLDVKALPPVTVTLVQPGETRKPQDEVEEKLLEIWKNVLRIGDAGVQDGFFELGGNSIQIMQLVYEINKCFPVSFQFTHFIERQTIERIADFIKEAIQEERKEELPFIAADPANRHEPFPLTNVQMAYYLGRSSHFELGGVSTHSYLEMATELDIRRLNQCLNTLIQRHPALHTVFLPDATQQILPEVPEYAICEYDLSGYTEEAKNKRIAKERDRMSHHIFNPNVWPLFEIVAFRLSPEESLLCISFDLLIMDAYSLEILQEEIMALYADRSLQLEELSITFRDYLVGYQQMKSGKWYLEDKEYWLQKVEDFPLAPGLPLLTQPQHVKNPYFKRKSKHYSQQHWRQLKQISQNHNLTPSAVLCTVYAEVLANWSNQPQFGLNLTLFNRLPLHSDVDKLIGDFTSLLLLEVRMNPKDSFWEKAGNIQRVLMEALAHRHFDGIDVMREISKRRELGNKALLPIVFTSALFDNVEDGGEAAEKQGETSDGEQSTNGITQTSQVYLDNQVALIHGNMVINWDYISELFDPAVMDAMFAQYLSRIEAILHSREEMGFPALPASDYASIQAYNHTEEPIPSKTLHGLFEEAVHQNPSAVAIEAGHASITYKELDDRADKVAGSLRSLGVSAGDRVGLIARKEIATFINILGILKSGAAYVPVDPEYPQERVDYIQNHSQCKLVLETDYYEKNCRGQHLAELQRHNHLPESLAYVIYTSGSTGNPKGVMISHQAACNTVQDINQKFQVGAADRMLGISSLCFDLSVYDIFGAFAAGATLVLVKDQKDIRQLADTLSAQKITIWNSVPAIMDRVGSEIKVQGISRENHDLRLVLLSGDWIPLHLPETVKQLFPAAKLISCGGATEASIWSIYYPIDEVMPQWTSIPYGMPLANQQFYVLNQQMDYCPLEVSGELYIGGSGVANGYLNDPEKTSHSFIHHPELGYIYRTGDYGVLHRDGCMEFLGRKDQQVKVGGYRIELGEVEAQLLRCGGVRHAVVLAADGEDKRLGAYLIPDSHSADQAAFINEVRARIAKVLPDYMIPHYFVVLEQFPLTANGKMDVQALLKLQPAGNKQMTAYAAPRNDVEERIVNIFKELLEADQIGTLDNFFEMGINSVQIAMINNKLKQEFQKEIPLLTLFEYANIHALAEYLSGNDQNEPDEVPQEQQVTRNQGKERMKQRSAKRRGHTDSE